jgi:N,N'-diacetyllegionaminate synthase
MRDVNLKAMLTIAKSCGIKTGYSDHTLGLEVPIAAVALGAAVIEKHFTLDKNMPGPDHKMSLAPKEFKKMVDAIRNIEKALGSSIKKISPSEYKNRLIARKSIVAKRDIRKGEIFSEQNITLKRPGFGISPILWDKVIGRLAVKEFKKDEFIKL